MPRTDRSRLQPETVAPRARRLLGVRIGPRGTEAVDAGGGHESFTVRSGPPDARDRDAIAARIRNVTKDRPDAVTEEEASGIAGELVNLAAKGVAELDGGAPDSRLSDSQVVALEAVLHTRGRPALRVLGDNLEDLALHPGAEIWQVAVDQHRDAVLGVCGATGAIRVRDSFLPDAPWVQGTAWLIAPDLALTNRHVLFPPGGGAAIARRIPGTTMARTKQDYGVTVDFAFDNGVGRDAVYRVIEMPFVSAERDAIDAAVLKVEKVSGPSPAPLPISRESVFDLERLYIVGHPGRLMDIPEKVLAVFGDPDERKRVSFGQKMEGDSLDPAELVHDASTIGGFSGGPLLGFLTRDVRALHYWGDPDQGNRAITATALRRHEILGPILPCGLP